jgi:hypothetical protein
MSRRTFRRARPQPTRERRPVNAQPEPKGNPPNLIGQFTRAISDVRARITQSYLAESPDIDEELELHERFLRKSWPRAHPSGDGAAHFDKAVKAREWRLKWLMRLEVLDRLASITWKMTVAVAALASMLHQWLP